MLSIHLPFTPCQTLYCPQPDIHRTMWYKVQDEYAYDVRWSVHNGKYAWKASIDQPPLCYWAFFLETSEPAKLFVSVDLNFCFIVEICRRGKCENAWQSSVTTRQRRNWQKVTKKWLKWKIPWKRIIRRMSWPSLNSIWPTSSVRNINLLSNLSCRKATNLRCFSRGWAATGISHRCFQIVGNLTQVLVSIWTSNGSLCIFTWICIRKCHSKYRTLAFLPLNPSEIFLNRFQLCSNLTEQRALSICRLHNECYICAAIVVILWRKRNLDWTLNGDIAVLQREMVVNGVDR